MFLCLSQVRNIFALKGICCLWWIVGIDSVKFIHYFSRLPEFKSLTYSMDICLILTHTLSLKCLLLKFKGVFFFCFFFISQHLLLLTFFFNYKRQTTITKYRTQNWQISNTNPTQFRGELWNFERVNYSFSTSGLFKFGCKLH